MDEELSPEAKADLKLVEDAANALGEHFETVQIFTTRHESGTLDGTSNVNIGVGNWFARYGQVIDWIKRKDRGE